MSLSRRFNRFKLNVRSLTFRPSEESMQEFTAADYRSLIAQRIRAEHVSLAARWLERLQDLIPVSAMEVFPTNTLLDHIPDLILEIGRYLEEPDREEIAANAQLLAQAQGLGALRYSQRASIHQIMREYRLLDAILLSFVREETEAWAGVGTTSEIIEVTAQIHQAVSVLHEATIQSFTARYAEAISDETRRLESFNRLVSHELRQPIGTMQFAIRLLQSGGPGKSGQEGARLVELLERNVQHLATLTNRLAHLSRLDASADNVHTQLVSLDTVVREVVRQLRDMAEARGVAIDIDDSLASAETLVDVASLELALINLVSNAIKYSDPQKPVRTIRIAGGDAPGGMHSIVVDDNGIGIPAGLVDSVFRRFVRAHPDRDAELEVDGLGLGLAIVKDCVRALDGTIRVQSTEGVGTTFTIEFPDRTAAIQR
jgi:signal transduction histidine kinase